MSDEAVVTRIKKLMALALNNPNEHEREAAMAKARELMVEHMVEESHLRGVEAPTSTAIYEFNNKRSFQTWMEVVFSGVAKLFDARVVVSKGRESDTAIFICADYDFELLKETTLTVIATILREAAVQARGLAAANSFRTGASQGFYSAAARIEKEAREAEKRGAETEVTALVHLKQTAIEQVFKERFPKLKTSHTKVSVSDADAYSKGWATGNGLGKQQKKIE